MGGDRFDRARCDWKFLHAMLRDAMSQGEEAEKYELPEIRWVLKVPVALAISVVFYIAVRIGGGWGSFEFRERYASLSEVLETYR